MKITRAGFMPDFRYRQTTVTLDVCGFAFRAAARQPLELGWRTAFPDWQSDAEKGDEVQLLSTLCDGEPVQLKEPSVEEKETRAPGRYNEGALIEAMQNAWRFVDDVALRERLKVAKGIGAPATRDRTPQSPRNQSASPFFFIHSHKLAQITENVVAVRAKSNPI